MIFESECESPGITRRIGLRRSLWLLGCVWVMCLSFGATGWAQSGAAARLYEFDYDGAFFDEPKAVQSPATTFEVFPILLFRPETRLGVGAGTWIFHRSPEAGEEVKPSNVWINVLRTQENQTSVRLIPELYLADGSWRARMFLQYLRFPTRYFGIGNDTQKTNEENYTPVARRFRLKLTHGAMPRLFVGLQLEFEDTIISELEPQGQLAAGGTIGSGGGTHSGAGLLLIWDRRDNLFYPEHGEFLEVSALRFNSALDSDFAFTRFHLDFRNFFLLDEEQVGGLQALYTSVSGNTPFYALPQLGGKRVFRGYFEGRFRDKLALVLQGEYRYLFGDPWGLVLFAATGQVAPDTGALKLGDFKFAAGAGGRYTWNRKEKLNLRLDVAFTNESSGVYFSVSEAF